MYKLQHFQLILLYKKYSTTKIATFLHKIHSLAKAQKTDIRLFILLHLFDTLQLVHYNIMFITNLCGFNYCL